MGNEYTKQQIRESIEQSIREMKNPDKRKEIKKKRLEKSKTIAKKYGL